MRKNDCDFLQSWTIQLFRSKMTLEQLLLCSTLPSVEMALAVFHTCVPSILFSMLSLVFIALSDALWLQTLILSPAFFSSGEIGNIYSA